MSICSFVLVGGHSHHALAVREDNIIPKFTCLLSLDGHSTQTCDKSYTVNH